MGHIFISYSHKDSEYAHALADRLQSMGFPVWIDARLDYGSQWPHEVQKYLDSCDAFIVIMSPRSFASEWVQSELQRAKRKAKPVFPLLLEGDETWLSVESTQYYNVRNGVMPDEEFYADLKQAISARTADSTRESAPKIASAKNIRAGSRTVGLLAAIGGFVVLIGVCLVMAVLWFRGLPVSSPLPMTPTGLDGITSQTAEAATLSPVTSQPTLAPLPVQLPDGPDVVISDTIGNRYQYTILSAQREALSPDKYLLRLRIRAWTNYVGGLNFWSDSFRLAAGDIRIAPVNDLNKLVRRDETVDGDVEFEIDASLQEAVLVITVGNVSDPWATKELRLVFP